MNDIRHIFFCFGLLLMLAACGSSDDMGNVMPPDDIVPDGETTKVSLAFSVSGTTAQQTRSSVDVIQQTGQTFRGLTDLHFISFYVKREIQKEDIPYPISVNEENTPINGKVDDKDAKFYFYNDCILPIGTASLLVYAKAKNIDGKEEKKQNGSTVANYVDYAPSKITFSPEQICNSTSTTASDAIASYLTDIANAEGWSSSTDLQLQAYYLNFIGKGSIAPTVIAGSSASVNAWVAKLYALINALEYEQNSQEGGVKTAILDKIINKPVQLTEEAQYYPTHIGLPDGAAALIWDDTKKEFVPQTSTTMNPSINDMYGFVYPAELCYFGNSQICTSNTGYNHSSDVSKNWGNSSTESGTVLANYTDPDVVSSLTRAVAVKKPIQYAVARLDATIKATSTYLKDASNTSIPVGSTSFPLTGIIVGGQRIVGFDFTPLAVEPPADDSPYLVYDRYLKTDAGETVYLTTTEQGPVHTLLLQSKDDENEIVILEFENNSDEDFAGINGIVYRGTKFYLIGRIDKPTFDASKDYTKRVFTQDYITTINVTVESLANAYNIVPNLLSPRLEIGVQMVTTWEQTPPTNLPLL